MIPEPAIAAAAEAIGRANRDYGDTPDAAVYRTIALAALEAAVPLLDGEPA